MCGDSKYSHNPRWTCQLAKGHKGEHIHGTESWHDDRPCHARNVVHRDVMVGDEPVLARITYVCEQLHGHAGAHRDSLDGVALDWEG